jgi:hypothetical protein
MLELRDNNLATDNLYRLYVSKWDFDETWYLETNPDLSTAIPSDVFPTGFAHFRAVGYAEGRLPFNPRVDSSWYLASYPDVASAIIRGAFDSAEQHFLVAGYREGRLPCDPEVDVDWYAAAYLPAARASADRDADCLQHFMTVGYLNGALPRPTMG